MAAKTQPMQFHDQKDPNLEGDFALEQKMGHIASLYYKSLLKKKGELHSQRTPIQGEPKNLSAEAESWTVGLRIQNESTGSSNSDEIGKMIGAGLRQELDKYVGHIVTADKVQNLNYAMYKATLEDLYKKFPSLSMKDQIWVLFHLGAQYFVTAGRQEDDQEVLTTFPAQAAREMGLSTKAELGEVLGGLEKDLGTSV